MKVVQSLARVCLFLGVSVLAWAHAVSTSQIGGTIEDASRRAVSVGGCVTGVDDALNGINSTTQYDNQLLPNVLRQQEFRQPDRRRWLYKPHTGK